MQAGTVTVLAGHEQLTEMHASEIKSKISILKSPKFWKISPTQANLANSWTNFFKGRVQWGHLFKTNCDFCKHSDGCKHRTTCKLYTLVNDEGDDVVTIQRVNVNAKLPVRSTSGAAGYDLSAAETAVVPPHGKCLVKTGLKMALPTGCYGRIAPRSGLAVKKFIDVGAGVIDADYRGEVGVVLFNFGMKIL